MEFFGILTLEFFQNTVSREKNFKDFKKMALGFSRDLKGGVRADAPLDF